MNAGEDHEGGLNKLTEGVIGAAYAVHNALGFGFLEKVYENSLAHELRKRGFVVEQQVGCPVRYDGRVVGEYVSDLVVEGRVLVELKAIRELDDAHLAQCLNYLAATGLPLCLLINFGRRVTVKRIRR
ncbi:MAG: GxxExxY protein [Phycisphaerales bacterium JB054]